MLDTTRRCWTYHNKRSAYTQMNIHCLTTQHTEYKHLLQARISIFHKWKSKSWKIKNTNSWCFLVGSEIRASMHSIHFVSFKKYLCCEIKLVLLSGITPHTGKHFSHFFLWQSNTGLLDNAWKASLSHMVQISNVVNAMEVLKLTCQISLSW